MMTVNHPNIFIDGKDVHKYIYPVEFSAVLRILARMASAKVDKNHMIEFKILENAIRTKAMDFDKLTLKELNDIIGYSGCSLELTIKAGDLAQDLANI